MADSDNTTSLSFVTRTDERAGTEPCLRAGELAAPARARSRDPALNLSLKWIKAHAETQALCIKQQELDALLSEQPGHPFGSEDIRRDHARALLAENLAAEFEQALMACLPKTPAHTIGGIFGKLSMILGECEDNTDATDFPGPHIRSVLDDLKRIAGEGGKSPEAETFPARRSP